MGDLMRIIRGIEVQLPKPAYRLDEVLDEMLMTEDSLTVSDGTATVRGDQPNGSEKLSNGGFESAGGGGGNVWADWVEVASDGELEDELTYVHSGSHAMAAMAGPSLNTRVYQNATVTAAALHTLSFWTRGQGSYAGRYSIYDNSNAQFLHYRVSTGVPGTTYTQVIVYVVTPSGCTSISIVLLCPESNGAISYFDDVSLKG